MRKPGWDHPRFAQLMKRDRRDGIIKTLLTIVGLAVSVGILCWVYAKSR